MQAGTYHVSVRAKGEGTTLTKRLTAVVTGSAELALATASEQLNASGTAGEQTELTLLVRNKGSAPLQGVEFSASPPSEWEVSFEPKTLTVLPPGQVSKVTARITPAGNAIAGDYIVGLSASAGSSNESVDVRYTVETSGWWGLIAVLVILAAIGGLLWAFRRFGRR